MYRFFIRLVQTLISISVLFLILALIMPFASGFGIKSGYQRMLNQMRPAPGVIFTKLLDYHQGWFTSEATVQVTVRIPTTKNSIETLSYVAKQSIRHGPFILTKALNNEWQLYFAKAIMHGETTHPNITQGSTFLVVQWNNLVRLQIKAKLINIVQTRPYQYVLYEPYATLTYSPNTKAIVGTVGFGGIQKLKSGKNIFLFNKVKYAFNVDRASGSWRSKHAFRAMQLTIFSKSAPLFFSDIILHLHSEDKGDISTLGIIIFIDELAGGESKIGPVEARLTASNIDSTALYALINSVAHKASLPAKNSTAVTFSEKLRQIIGKGLQLDLSQLNIGTGNGTMSASGALHIPTQATSPGIKTLALESKANLNLLTPPRLTQEVLARLFIVTGIMPQGNLASALNQASILLKMWIKQGVFIKDGQMLKLKLDLQEGKALLNGRPIPMLRPTDLTQVHGPAQAESNQNDTNNEQW